MKELNKINKKNNISFGLLFFSFFLIIGLYPLISNGPIRIWSVIVSLVFNDFHDKIEVRDIRLLKFN